MTVSGRPPRMRTTMLAVAFLLVLAPAVLADGASQSWRYVVGGGAELAGGPTGVCTSGFGEPKVGGTCDVPVLSAEVRVTVVDDADGDIAFTYSGTDAAHGACGFFGSATSPATLAPPAACAWVSVSPALGSLSGTITASS